MMGNHQLVSNSNSDPYTPPSGPSLANKPLQEYNLIIDGTSPLLTVQHFTFHISDKIYNCKIDTSHAKMELWEPSGKV